jgi:DNA-directed RNA polymerase-3 subunit RPC5
VEVELPLDVRQTVYNLEKGQEMARGAEHGGTFGEKKVKKEPGSSRRDREREKEKDKAPKRLEKTRLESQLVPNQTRYFVGVIRDGESGCACVVAGALPRAKSGSVEDRLLTPAN